MATVKSEKQFFEPDPASQGLAPPLEKQYEMVLQCCRLNDRVPEDVQSYLNAVVTLYLYGWLYYPFYTLAHFLSSVVVEMALRERFPWKPNRGGRDRRGLKKLLKEAKATGLLRDQELPSLEHRRANAEEISQQITAADGRPAEPVPEVPYVDVLIETLPWLRNDFAHPRMHAILPPGPALNGPILAAQIINQLWPKAASE